MANYWVFTIVPGFWTIRKLCSFFTSQEHTVALPNRVWDSFPLQENQRQPDFVLMKNESRNPFEVFCGILCILIFSMFRLWIYVLVSNYQTNKVHKILTSFMINSYEPKIVHIFSSFSISIIVLSWPGNLTNMISRTTDSSSVVRSIHSVCCFMLEFMKTDWLNWSWKFLPDRFQSNEDSWVKPKIWIVTQHIKLLHIFAES